jgi:hypothetical protein
MKWEKHTPCIPGFGEARVSTDIVAQAVKFADILFEEEFVPDYDELSHDDDLPKQDSGDN